jgi:4-aminobutyrate--pyruvate transaminase
MITVAKALSASYLPISALMVSEAVYQALVAESEKIGTFGHGYTYSGHPVAAAVAIETLKIYEERDIVGQVRRVAPRFLAGIRACAEHPLVGEADGVGLIGAIQLVQSKAPKTFFDMKAGIAPAFTKFAQERGLIVRPLFGDRVALCPPLIITEDQVDEMFRRFRGALDDTAALVRQKGLAPAA